MDFYITAIAETLDNENPRRPWQNNLTETNWFHRFEFSAIAFAQLKASIAANDVFQNYCCLIFILTWIITTT